MNRHYRNIRVKLGQWGQSPCGHFNAGQRGQSPIGQWGQSPCGQKKYPKYFTPDVYCTTTATKFAQDHGANDIPNSNGPVKYGGETNTKPNPKTLAENMSDNGGIVIKPPKKRR